MRHEQPRPLLLAVCLGTLLGVAVLATLVGRVEATRAAGKPPPPARNLPQTAQIVAGYPLTITAEDTTQFQVRYRDYGDQFYGADAEGVFLWVNLTGTTTVYGPGNVPAGGTTNAYTPISNTLTGTGTGPDPWVVTTINQVPGTNLRLTQRLTYINGTEYANLAFQVEQIGGTSPLTVTLFHAADLYTASNDSGYGFYDPRSGGVGDYFTPTVGSLAGVRLYQQFVPNLRYPAPSAYQEGIYSTIWGNIGSTSGPGPGFDNTVISNTLHDSGAGLQWSNLSVPPAGSITVGDTDLFSPQAALPAPTPPPPPPAALVTGPGDQQAPRVDGHMMVYEDNSTGDWDIMAKDLATAGATPFPVYRGPGDQRAPAISGDLVVWQDNRNGTWDIYGRHLSGGAEFAIATGPGDQTHPRVQGLRVVWENTLSPGHTSIASLDLAGGAPVTLSDAASTNLNPDVAGNLVVWQSTVPTLTLAVAVTSPTWQIVGYDLTTQLTSTLSVGPASHTDPAVSRNTVVWVTTQPALGAAPGAPGDSSIDGVDLRGGGRTPIQVSAPLAGTHPSQPRVRDRQVAYVDEQDVDRNSAVIVSANLDTQASTVVSDRGANARDPAIADEGNVVWRRQSSAGDGDLFITGCQPPAFSDVPANAYFATPVGWLTCVAAISGYADGTFRPYANTTRGQLAKIIVGAAGWALNTTGGPHFSDLPPSNPFYPFIETAYNRGIISGYADGTFRPYANVTRGQLSKIVVGAQGWAINTTGGPHFSDVPPGDPFYPFVETAYNHGIISGYADGTFRVGAEATRGQIAKIVYIAITTP